MLRVILNPASRGGLGGRLRGEIERELERRGLEGDVVLTSSPGDAVRLARTAASDGIAVVVAAGGDGTMHEVANGLLQAADAGLRPPVLGLVPIGTGNDFVKVIPGTSSRARAYDTLARGRAYPFDAGHASWGSEGEYFLNSVGTGIDVEVVRQIARRSRRSGALVYIDGLLRALARYRPVALRIEADGVTTEQRVMTIAVSNGVSIGGLFRLTPGALPADGMLDLCAVRELSLPRIPAMAARILRGRHVGRPGVETRRVQRVTVRVLDGSPLFFQLDGELREPVGVPQLEIEVRPARLHVLAAAAPGGASESSRIEKDD